MESNLQIAQQAAVRVYGQDEWHPVSEAVELYMAAKLEGESDRAVSLLRMLFPYLCGHVGSIPPPPPEAETTPEAAKEKLQSLLARKVPDINEMRRIRDEASNS